jgi:hypothetical protein
MAKKKLKPEEQIQIPNPNLVETKSEYDDLLKMTELKYKNCEWCYQFDEDEPQVFAWTDDVETETDSEEPTVSFTLSNNNNSYITFRHGDKVFKLFARDLTEIGKSLREKANESIKNELKNESTNKEA